MFITHKKIYLKPLVAALYNKGHTNIIELENFLTREYQLFQARMASVDDNIISDVVKAVEKDNDNAELH